MTGGRIDDWTASDGRSRSGSRRSLAFASGCSRIVAHRPEPHASDGLLNSGPATKVTSRQAADVQFALGRSLEDGSDPSQAEAAYRKAIENDPEAGRRPRQAGRRPLPQGGVRRGDEGVHRRRPLRPEERRGPLRPGLRLLRPAALVRGRIELPRGDRPGRDPRPQPHQPRAGLRPPGRLRSRLSEFLRAGCDVSDAKANLGLILAMENHLPEAQKAYAEALAAKPGSPVARQGLATLAKARGDQSGGLASGERRSERTIAVSRASADIAAPRPPR